MGNPRPASRSSVSLRLITFTLLEKRFPIMVITKWLDFTGIPADEFQKNVRIVFMRVILSRSVIKDVWLKTESN